MKKNRKGILLLFFCLSACTRPQQQAVVDILFEPDGMVVSTTLHFPRDILFNEDSVSFEHIIVYDLTIRTKSILTESIKMSYWVILEYDPYSGLYQLEKSDMNNNMYFSDRTELRNYIQKPMQFLVPSRQLAALRNEKLSVSVDGTISVLSKDSVFQGWLTMFNTHLYRESGQSTWVRYE